MKIYISFDIEGVTGITNQKILKHYQNLHLLNKWQQGDVNAAILGAYEAGANEVNLFTNGHGFRSNLLFDRLSPKS